MTPEIARDALVLIDRVQNIAVTEIPGVLRVQAALMAIVASGANAAAASALPAAEPAPESGRPTLTLA